MKIHHTYHRREVRIEIVTSLAGKLRLAALGLAGCCAGLAFIAPMVSPKQTAILIPGTLAFLALAIALGRFVYLIKPGSHVRLRLTLLGIPVFSTYADASTFHSFAINTAGNGSADLRFTDAAGQPALTITGFPDLESAEQVATLFHLDEDHRKKAADNLIDHAVVAERSDSPWLGTAFVCLAFTVSPALAWLFREGMDGLGTHLIAGFFIVLIATYMTGRDRGIIAVSKDRGTIDRWERKGLFRRIEYRQHLTGDHEPDFLGSRFDGRYPVIALLLLAQFAAIFGIVRRNETADRARSEETRQLEDRAQDEDVLKGAEKFQELLKQRKERDQEPAGP
ncbi:MAG: hypothetical protein V4689_00680 [Verrucomicrobiota bacterium]